MEEHGKCPEKSNLVKNGGKDKEEEAKILEAGRGGGGQAPTGGLDKPTTAPRIESVILYPQGIRLSCCLWAR